MALVAGDVLSLQLVRGAAQPGRTVLDVAELGDGLGGSHSRSYIFYGHKGLL